MRRPSATRRADRQPDAARAAYQIPTDNPEADGTMAWTSTTLVVVEVEGGGKTGMGYTYTDACIVGLINKKLRSDPWLHERVDPPGALAGTCSERCAIWGGRDWRRRRSPR